MASCFTLDMNNGLLGKSPVLVCVNYKPYPARTELEWSTTLDLVFTLGLEMRCLSLWDFVSDHKMVLFDSNCISATPCPKQAVYT